MPELLIELFSEEIPARMQKRAADDLKKLVTDKLTKAGLVFKTATAHVTPRRLALVIDGLPARQPDVREERRGPRADAPEKALAGFLGSVGLSRNQVEARETPKGTFLYAVIEKTGAETRSVLPAIILEAIQALPWQKSMRWAGKSFRWVRPLHHVLALFDGAVLDGSLALGDWTLGFTDTTRGHRFLAPDPITVVDFATYEAGLRAAFVILDREERKRIIAEGAAALAQADGLVLRDDPGLLEEVCGLVEWPVPLIGTIEDAFMAVPPEALVTAMRTHQKYFALEAADGALAPRFITVSNMAADPTRDATIVVGNEKVLRARLSDARFFWNQDRAKTLESRVPALATVTFYDKLGTLADKMARVEALAGQLAEFVPGCDAGQARRAARLAKADLTTEMVGEFPELQGIMGRYYARHDGESDAVCNAISEHYAPQGPSDSCPTAPVSVAVALADKLDTLVGFFAIDEKPTGSKDPFALRRAALGVIRLIIENALAIPLRQLIGFAYDQIAVEGGLSKAETAHNLLDFFVDRLKVHLRDKNIRHDYISAVLSLGAEDDLNRLVARANALANFLGEESGKDLLVAYRRAANIVRIEAKKHQTSYDEYPEPNDRMQPEELTLYEALDEVNQRLDYLVADDKFDESINLLSTLRVPVDAFFDQVTVNVSENEIRENRLRFLSSLVTTMNQVADFSKVEG